MVGEVHPEHVFSVCDGTSIKNLEELGARLKRMSGAAFSHHVTGTRNDFATWVQDCMGDKALSSRLMVSTDQREMCLLIGERIAKIKAQNGESKRMQVLRSEQKPEKKSFQKPVVRSAQVPVVRSQPIAVPLLPAPKQEKPQYALSDVSASIERMRSSVVSTRYSAPAQKEQRVEQKSAESLKPSLLEEQLLRLARKSPPKQETKQEASHKPVQKVSQEASSKPIPRSSSKQVAKVKPARSPPRPLRKQKAQSTRPAQSSTLLKLPYEAYNYPDAPAYQQVSSADHEHHTSCMRCGLTEFLIGLVVGLTLAFVLARAVVGI